MELKLKGNLSEKVYDPSISLPLLKNARNNTHQTQEILKKIHKKYWVACDCSDSALPPIMTVRKRDARYSLVNIAGYGVHNKQCPFHYIPNNSDNVIRYAGGNTFMFNVHNNEMQKQDSVASLAMLKNLMFYLIDNGDVNTIYSERTFSSNIRAILEAAMADVYVNGEKIENKIQFGLEQFVKVKEMIQSEINQDLHAVPYFIFDIVDSVELLDNYLLLKKRAKGKDLYSFKFYKELTHTSELTLSEGPFLILTSISQVKSKTGTVIAPTLSYFQPIANKLNWMPIANPLERLVIDKLTASIKWYKEKLGLSFKCTKLLKPVINELGRSHPLLKISLGEKSEYLDIQFDKDRSKNTQRILDYIVLSKSAGGAYFVIDSDKTEKEIKAGLFNVISDFLKALKNSEKVSKNTMRELK